MNEVEYVVPPGNQPSKSTGVSGSGMGQNSPKLPKKPNMLVEWVKSHKFLSVAMLIMAGILVSVSFVMVTGQKVSLFGLQLNPLYNKANCDSEVKDGSLCGGGVLVPDDKGGGDTGSTISKIILTGDFAAGTVGQNYETIVSTSGVVAKPCTWRIISSTPTISKATIAPRTLEGNEAIYSTIPANVGDYKIVIKATCADGQTGQKEFSWSVKAAGQTPVPGQLDLSANFTNGVVNTAYSTNISTVNAKSELCVLTLNEIKPELKDAKLTKIDNVVAPVETTVTFEARPTTVGTYVVKVSASCGPENGEKKVVTKSFNWTVQDGKQPPVQGSIDISGSFPDGKINTDYSTNIQTTNADTSECSWTLVSVNPAVSGAALSRVDNFADAGESMATFTARARTLGTYTVNVSVSCGPADGAKRTGTKSFTWKVTALGTQTGGVHPNGTLIINLPGQNNPTGVYLIENGKIRPFATAEVFICLGYDWNKIVQATVEDAALPVGAEMTCSTGGGGSGGGGGSSSSTCMTKNNISKLTAIYRWWSPAASDHFYTTSAAEKPSGYRFEGISGYVFNEQVANSEPIYRSSNSSQGAHYYSTINDAAQYGFTPEGIIGYAYTSSVTGSSPWFRLYKGAPTFDYVATTSEQEKNATVELGYADEGIIAHLCGGSSPTELQPVFRLWSSADGDHFYTTNFSERDSLLTRGYVSEGISGYIYGVRKDGSLPLYRSYSRAIGDHFYTTSEAEAKSAGYTFEGIMGFIASSDDASTTPWRRLYNPTIGDHFYTASDQEFSSATRSGYFSEGDTGYIYLSQ